MLRDDEKSSTWEAMSHLEDASAAASRSSVEQDHADWEDEHEHGRDVEKGQHPIAAHRPWYAWLGKTIASATASEQRVVDDDDEAPRPLLPRPLLPRHAHTKQRRTIFVDTDATLYLNGIRGVAAFLVFMTHNYKHLSYPSWLARSNIFINILFPGSPAIGVFFVVSGMSTSLMPLRLARAHAVPRLGTHLMSSVMRRYGRIFLPILAAMIMEAPLAYLGLLRGRLVSTEPASSLPAQLWHAVKEFVWTADPFRGPPQYARIYSTSTTYDPNLWALPVEFHGSMVLALLILGLGRARSIVRSAVLLGLGSYALFIVRQWGVALFIAGGIMAELHLVMRSSDDVTERTTTPSHVEAEDHTHLASSVARNIRDTLLSAWHGCGRVVVLALLLAISIFALVIPEGQDSTIAKASDMPIFSPMRYAYGSMEWPIWSCLGAIAFVYCVDSLPWVQGLFKTGRVQHLGRISYSLYLVHGPVVRALGERTCQLLQTAGASDAVAALSTSALLIPTVIFLAKMFSRFVDENAVLFAKWAYKRTCR